MIGFIPTSWRRWLRPAAIVPILWTGAAAWGQIAGPELDLDPPVLEYGTIFDTDAIEEVVLVRNLGDRTVTISGVGATCETCLTYTMDRRTLDPGEVTELVVAFTPEGMLGPIQVYLVLDTDREDDSAYGLPITADVVEQYHVIGGRVYFENMVEDEVRTWALRIRPHPAMPPAMPLSQVDSDHPGFRGDLSYESGSGEYRLVITAGPDLTTGMNEAWLWLSSEDPGVPPCVIPASAFRVPPLHVFPGRLVLDSKDSEQLRIVFVRQTGGRAGRLTGIEVPGDRVAAVIYPDAVLPNYRVNVYAYGMSGESGFIGNLSVFTDLEDHDPVEIPMYVENLHGVVVTPSCYR